MEVSSPSSLNPFTVAIAAAKAINDAKKSVAEKNRDGEIGQAMAHQDQRVQVAAADATAVEGENTAKITIANSDAERRTREAEAERKAVAAEKVTQAKALEEAGFEDLIETIESLPPYFPNMDRIAFLSFTLPIKVRL